MHLLVNIFLIFALLQLVNYTRLALLSAAIYGLALMSMGISLNMALPYALLLGVVAFAISWFWFCLLNFTDETAAWWIVLFVGLLCMVSWPFYV